jgi:hypothetical protein
MSKFSDFLSVISVKYNIVSENLITDHNEFIKEEEVKLDEGNSTLLLG